jgi:cell wall-associated NlpC family hydrolase
LALALLLALPGTVPLTRATEPSLGEKVKKFFVTPTPTPTRRRSKHKKSNPTPSPSPSASPKAKSEHKAESSPAPTSEKKEGTRPKRKKSSPTPSPSPTPTPAPAAEASPSPSSSPAGKVATVLPDAIEGYDKNPEPVRKLLDLALALTKRNLDYTYGSADPASGGMDCSGFIYYVLRENGVQEVPRDASGQYVWVRKAGNFRAVLSRDIDSFELDELRPGDLLFWTGTYGVERDPPVTHTMIYLGKEKKTGKPIMVGASDGRTYEGEKRFGVSVFDFRTARANAVSTSGTQPRFVGYAKIPGLGDEKP